MAVSCTSLNYRNRTVIDYSLNKSPAASWNQYIHIFIHLHKFCCGFPGGIFNKGNRILCNSLCLKCTADTVYNGSIGMDRITSALKDHGITGLEAKGKGICGNIWSGFINNSNHAKRNPFLTDHKSVWTLLHSGHFPYRILQRGNLAQSLCHPFYSRLCKHQTVYKAFRHLVISAILHINGIRIKKHPCIRHKTVCNSLKNLIFLGSIKIAKDHLRLAGILTQGLQHFIHL